MATRESLFIYGSFCSGMVHFEKISQYIVSQRSAVTTGSMYRLPVGYPVFLKEGNNQVWGQWVEIEAPDVLFRLLDEFHGYSLMAPEKSLFLKTEIEIQCLETFEKHMVQTYCLSPAKLPRNAMPIENGDWRQSLKESPALPDSLTERQVCYIRKLGASSGRDIVPIDLQLYRELMKLDLIVDKGRRLALTKLGKDVYRFLPHA